MRVTQSMIFDQGLVGINDARSREEEAIAESSTGVKVSHPGDDPAAAAQIVVHRLSATRMDAIQTAVGRASDELDASDTALNTLTNIMTRARQLAVQMANDTYSANDRTAAAAEVQGMFQDAIGALNTRVGNRYVFGGNVDNKPPFDNAGNYQGDAGVRQVEIAPGVLQDASIRADVMAKGTGGGVDVLGTLTALASALSSNNSTAVANTLNNLETGQNQISLGRAQIGAQMSTLDVASQAASTAVGSEKKTISNLADADAIDAAGRLAQAETALNAALTATAHSFSLSLVDKMT